MAVAALVLWGATSCAKENGVTNPDEGKTGTLTINFSLAESAPSGPESRAIANSTSKPITTWASVNNMMLLLTDGTTVKDAYVLTVPTTAPTTLTGRTQVVENLMANSTGWTAYIIGNYPSDWTVGSVKNRALSSLKVETPASTTYASSPLGTTITGSNGFSSPAEVFIARTPNVVIAPGQAASAVTATFTLQRAVSLVRVRIEQGTGINKDIKFTDAGTGVFALRRVAKSFDPSAIYTYPVGNPKAGIQVTGNYLPAPAVATDVFYSAGPMKSTAPATSTHTNVTTILANGIDVWNEYMVWPGGGSITEAAKRFDIVIGGKTAASYVNANGQTVAAGAMVYWTAAVNQPIGPNQILELVLTLNNPGTTDPPAVGNYGNLTVDVNLIEWGEIVGVDIPMK